NNRRPRPCRNPNKIFLAKVSPDKLFSDASHASVELVFCAGDPRQVSPAGIVTPRDSNDKSSRADSSSIALFNETVARVPTKQRLPTDTRPNFSKPSSMV